MSRIVSATLERRRLPFREPVRYGTSMLSTQEIGVLRIATDDGLVGLGEMAGPELPHALETTVDAIAKALAGAPPDEAPLPQGRLRAAVDCALLDIMGQMSGRSMTDVLGGGGRMVVVNGLPQIGTGSADADAGRARDLADAGFGSIKIKRAADRTGESDGDAVGASLRAIRAAVGPSVGLRLDLNGDLPEEAAIRWLGALPDVDLEYVEQPIAPSAGVSALARIRAAVAMPIAADESLTDLDAARSLIGAGACDVLVVKLARVGGPRASVEIADVAATAGIPVTISTMYDSGIGLAAALHVAATVGHDRAHGLGTAALLGSDLIGGSLPIVAGAIRVPTSPGLGVTLVPGADGIGADS